MKEDEEKNKPNKTIETKIILANIHLIEPSMTAILSNDNLPTIRIEAMYRIQVRCAISFHQFQIAPIVQY